MRDTADILDNVDVRMSFRNGLQITIDIDGPDAWHYVAVGVNDRLQIRHGVASDDDVDYRMTTMEIGSDERPVRKYAAGHEDNIETLLEVDLYGAE